LPEIPTVDAPHGYVPHDAERRGDDGGTASPRSPVHGPLGGRHDPGARGAADGGVVERGADIHDYWNYPLLVALALGAAVLLESVAGVLTARAQLWAKAVPLALAALVVLANLSTTSAAEASVRGALGTPRLLDVAVEHAPPTGPVMAYSSYGRARSPWIAYESGREGLPLDGRPDLVDLARRSPSFPMLVILTAPDDRVNDALRSAAWAVDGYCAVVPAAEALAAYRLAD